MNLLQILESDHTFTLAILNWQSSIVSRKISYGDLASLHVSFRVLFKYYLLGNRHRALKLI